MIKTVDIVKRGWQAPFSFESVYVHIKSNLTPQSICNTVQVK